MGYFDALFSGVKWTGISSVLVAAGAILKIAILTRFLAPADFGHYALVTSILSFIYLFSDFGLPVALLHKQQVTPLAFSSLYWLGLTASIFIYAVFYSLVPVLAHFFREAILQDLLPVAGLAILINYIGNQYKILALKNLSYRYIALVNILESILSLMIAFGLAWYGWGIWALIYASLFSQFVMELLFLRYGLRHQPLQFVFSITAIQPFFAIGKYSVGGQLINYFTREIDILLIAKLGGDAAILGAYSLAKQLVMKIGSLTNNIISEATRPILPRFQDDLDRLRQNFLKIVGTISTINSLIYGIFLLFTPQIITILYGQEYESITFIARVLALFAFLRMIIRFNGNLIIATGKTQLSLLINAITLPLTALAIGIGFQYHLPGVAWGQTIAMTLLLFISWYLVIYRLLKIRLPEYLFSLLPSYNLIREILFRLPLKHETKNIKPGK